MSSVRPLPGEVEMNDVVVELPVVAAGDAGVCVGSGDAGRPGLPDAVGCVGLASTEAGEILTTQPLDSRSLLLQSSKTGTATTDLLAQASSVQPVPLPSVLLQPPVPASVTVTGPAPLVTGLLVRPPVESAIALDISGVAGGGVGIGAAGDTSSSANSLPLAPSPTPSPVPRVSHFDLISDEMLHKVLSFLPPPSLYNVLRVSRRFLRVCGFAFCAVLLMCCANTFRQHLPWRGWRLMEESLILLSAACVPPREALSRRSQLDL